MSNVQAMCRLANTPFFSEFSNELLQTIEQAATVRKIRKNTHIIVSGEESHAAYVLLNGTASAFTEDEEGNEFVIQSFGKGDCFGELGMLDAKPRTANVMTTSDCECLVIPRVVIMRALDDDPMVAKAIVRTLVGRIRGMTEDVSCLALMDVYGRLVRALKKSANEASDGTLITEKITHQELANRVGSSREMISKILKDLRVGGYIGIEKQGIVLLKPLPERW